MTYIDAIGFCAGVLTSTSFIPQVYKIWRTKDTRAISSKMYAILCMGFVLWVVYGVLRNSFPVILTNLVTLTLALSILYLKITHEKKKSLLPQKLGQDDVS